MRIENVIFDLGNVLVEWDLRHLFAKLIDDAEELNWFLDNVVTLEWHFEHDAGRSLDDMIAERVALFPEHEALIGAYRQRFSESIPHTIAGMPEILEQLAARETPLFAITNFGAEFFARYRPTQTLFDHFRDIVVSGEEKLVKPDPAIYALAMRRFGIAPHSALFVDDNLANVESARKFGLQAHHFKGAEPLRKELETFGLLD